MDSPDSPATPAAILALRGQDGFSDEALRRALELALAPRGARDWAAFLDRLLLVVGAVMATAGVVFFFAWNWEDLGRFARIGLAELALVGAALAAWRLGPERPAGQVMLVVSAVLVGPLLGVYGQAYQTGADAWTLFAAWTLLAIPWLLAGRSTALGLLVLVIANLAAGLAWTQEWQRRAFWEDSFHLAMFALNGVAWLGWEGARWRSPGPLSPSWISRALAGLCLFHLAVPCWAGIVESLEGPRTSAFLLLGAVLFGVFRLFRLRDRDLFVPALGFAAAISVVTTALGQMADLDNPGMWLFIGLAVVGQVAGAAAWLRHAGSAP